MITGLDICIKVAENIYVWYAKGYQPPRLSGNMLALFQKFKKAYDYKNINNLSDFFSESYSGFSMWGSNKEEFKMIFSQFFKSLPKWVNLNLRIDVYQILESNEKAFKAILDFNSNVTIWIIPVQEIDAGQVYVEVRPESPYGIWKISKIEQLKV